MAACMCTHYSLLEINFTRASIDMTNLSFSVKGISVMVSEQIFDIDIKFYVS